MKLAENLIDIFKVIAIDETLLRLLYYKDDPLNPDKTNIKDLPNFHEIRRDRILRSPKADDLTEEPICRICMYFGNGSNTSNEQVSDQEVHFDIFAHIDEYDMNDARALRLCDYINELIYSKHITGIGKVRTARRRVITNAAKGYIGYGMVFVFGSVK